MLSAGVGDADGMAQWDATVGERKHWTSEDEQEEWIGDKNKWDQPGDEPKNCPRSHDTTKASLEQIIQVTPAATVWWIIVLLLRVAQATRIL